MSLICHRVTDSMSESGEVKKDKQNRTMSENNRRTTKNDGSFQTLSVPIAFVNLCQHIYIESHAFARRP